MRFPPFILASASPARRRLLQSIGLEPLIYPSHFDESQIATTDPIALVQALAEAKARAAIAQMAQQRSQLESATEALVFQTGTPTLWLGCDSVLSFNGAIHGKPANPAEAIDRWQQMRGQIGELYTGHALFEVQADSAQLQPARSLVRYRMTRVFFASVSDAEIAAYVATQEPLNCAGAFALEGFGGCFIDQLEGCHTNVIGLSLPLLREMLIELGHDLTTRWPGVHG